MADNSNVLKRLARFTSWKSRCWSAAATAYRQLNLTTTVIVLTLILQLKSANATLPNVVKLGGLFENGDETVEMAFRDAVERINSDETILPNTRLEAVIEKLERCDSFQASKKGKLCSTLFTKFNIDF